MDAKVIELAAVARLRRGMQPKQTPRILLLQGPVGPFMREFQTYLNANGYDAWRISFNGGDRFFAGRNKVLHYRRGIAELRDWLSALIDACEFDRIVLLGAEREIHRIARDAASAAGVPVLALEEGYLRPGYITAEYGGNNASSPVAGKLPPEDYEPKAKAALSGLDPFRAMCWHGFLYFFLRGLVSGPGQRQTFHRKTPILPEFYFWMRNYGRYLFGVRGSYRTIERLLERRDKRYYIVPLQVPDDTQIRVASNGWNNLKLMTCAIASFARHAPPDTELVIKIHPLHRGHSHDGGIVASLAKMAGVSHRVHLINHGSFGLLCRHSAGVVTINSTAGFSAIAHGVPLFLFGDAIYRNARLAWCAKSECELDRFWTEGKVAPAALRRGYLGWLTEKCLIAGDFYDRRGYAAAFAGLRQLLGREVEGQAEGRAPARSGWLPSAM